MWEITAYSRLHCGLLDTAEGESYRFGGIGFMVSRPFVRLRIGPSSNTVSHIMAGAEQSRIEFVVQRFEEHLPDRPLRPYHLELVTSPPAHAGFGSGTQLACAVTSLLNAWSDASDRLKSIALEAADRRLPLKHLWQNASELALVSGRGRRSSIGVHGFLQGGFAFDAGHDPEQYFGHLEKNFPLPSSWQVILATPTEIDPVSGPREQRWMDEVAERGNPCKKEMLNLILDQMLPFAESGHWDNFVDALQEYGRLAGVQFSQLQGGPYRGPKVAALVQRMGALGLRGVCQSSWGPSVFGIAFSETEGRNILNSLRREFPGEFQQLLIGTPCNQSATLRYVAS